MTAMVDCSSKFLMEDPISFVQRRASVSFIIPVLNEENNIGRCLNSIQNQDYPPENFEVIVVDNGSTDGTLRIVREYGFDLQVVPHVSIAALRNQGARMARSDFLAFIDADVELMPDWLHIGTASFADPKVLAAGGPRCIPEGATWVQQTWGLHLTSRRPQGHAAPVGWLYSMAFMVRRDSFVDVGGYNEDLETAEDVDLCYRLGRRGAILYKPAMKAIHWGEDPDLRTFWRKEVWRGTSNLKGVLAHGWRWDELPSLGYPIYILCVLALFGFGCILDASNRQLQIISLSFGLLVLPAMLLAIDTSGRAKQFGAFHGLFVLYLLYGLARAYALCARGFWPRR